MKTLKEKQDKIIELGKMISLSGKLSYTKRGKIEELQDRLDFELRRLEEEAMDLKIETMEKVLKIIHKK